MSESVAELPRRAATARTRARRRAERRFRAYGLAAIALAALFVVVVLADILRKGLPAFFEHGADLALFADPAVLDPGGKRVRDDLLAADYKSLVRKALHAQFPAMQSRAERKLLNGLLSSGAEDDFRQTIVSRPERIGETVRVSALFTDEVDQYFKGAVTRTRWHAGSGSLRVAQSGDTVSLTATGGEFAPAIAAVRASVATRLRGLQAELARVETAAHSGRDGAESLAEKAAALRTEISGLQSALEAAPVALDAAKPSVLVFAHGGALRAQTISPDAIAGEMLVPFASLDEAPAGSWKVLVVETPPESRRIGDAEIAALETLRDKGAIRRGFAFRLFTSGDSREPELAGLRGALVGSLLMLVVTLALSLPLGVGAAIYLEEFAPKNRWTELIEININNLAAVPSIVFGLLGLAIFLDAFGLPRSAPLVGGLVMALLVLPTIIIAARAALKAVPPSIGQAALAVGASRQQAVFHHVLPLAVPGIMTGTIIGMARALGETAPLLMIGMVAFIVDIPRSFGDAATALPVQIYLWSDLPEAAFEAKTAATILVLLLFLFLMNLAAILVRRRYEKRW